MSRQIINALIISAIVGAATYLIRLKKLGDRIQYKLIKVSRNRGTTIQSSSISADIELINPTNASLDVQSISGKIYYGDQVLGTIQSKQPFTIKTGVSKMSLNFVIDNQSLLSNIVKYVLNKENIGRIYAKYSLKTPLGIIPQSFEVNPKSLI